MSVVGQRVGRYEVTSLLGKGGMGVVYKALDTDSGLPVALKSLPSADAASLLRFKQEFRALSDLSHPHLAVLYELVAVETGWWLAMEFVDGVDLLSHILGPRARRSPASGSEDEETRQESAVTLAEGPISRPRPGASVVIQPDQLARLRPAFGQLAQALHALHNHDTLHRDVKPSNVMVDSTGRTVLLDFGLVTAISESGTPQQGTEVAGTVPYMAPEQALGRALTPAADWYAVGVMLYEVLTGHLPFTGSRTDVLRQKIEGRLAPLRDTHPWLPEDVRSLCDTLLQAAPEDRPWGREILARLGMRDPEDDSAGEEMLVGREPQLAALQQALERVVQGGTVTAFVRGRSGAGKSQLLRHFVAGVRGIPDAVVLSGRCYEDESVPYKALDSLIDALARFIKGLPEPEREALAPADAATLSRVFPVLRQFADWSATPHQDTQVPDPQELRRRAFRALRELLRRIGSRRLLVLHVDDLQWGDADSAALISDLLRPPDAPVALFLCAYRSEYESNSVCLKALTRDYAAMPDRAAVVVDVGPLDASHALDLARALLPGQMPDRDAHAERIVRESGGVPFFVHELARHTAADATAASRAPAEDLDGLIRRRVDRLPAATREVLELVSVCGHPITRHALAAAAGLADRGVLRQLRTTHLVRTTGVGDDDWVEPYHDRIREAVAGGLDAGTIRSLHHRLAVSLEDAGVFDPEMLAVHFEHGGRPERAGTYYAQAADAAADALAFERASHLYDRALHLHPGTPDDAQRLRVRWADALANSGRGPDAARAYLTAAERAVGGVGLDLQRRAAYQYCVSGHLEEGRSTLRRLLAGIGVPMPERRAVVILRLLYQRAKLRVRGLRFTPRAAAQVPPAVLVESDLTWAASAGLSMFDVIAGAEFQSRNLYHALQAGEPSRVARALAWEAAHTSNTGSSAWRRTARLLEAARAITATLDDPHAQGMTALSTGIAEFTMGRWASARDRLIDAEDILRGRCRGVAWELDTAHTFELWARIYAGDFAAMTARTRLLMKEAEERGDRHAVTNLGSFMEPHGRLVEGNPSEASATVDRALERWGIEGYHLQHLTALMMRVYIDLYEGRGQTALARLVAKRGWVRAGFFNTIQVLRVVLMSLEGRAALMTATAVAGRAGGLALAVRSARGIERERVAWATPLARLLRAGASALEGQREAAVSQLETAAHEFDAVPMDGYAAAARWRAAQLLGPGERADALRARAGVWLQRESVRDPERMATMLAFGEA